jgi:hypothetical protein
MYEIPAWQLLGLMLCVVVFGGVAALIAILVTRRKR